LKNWKAKETAVNGEAAGLITATGSITFINSHDYKSDDTPVEGCLATMLARDGRLVFFYTTSLRLHHTLEMAYATGRSFSVTYETEALRRDTLPPLEGLSENVAAEEIKGPFKPRAIFTVD